MPLQPAHPTCMPSHARRAWRATPATASSLHSPMPHGKEGFGARLPKAELGGQTYNSTKGLLVGTVMSLRAALYFARYTSLRPSQRQQHTSVILHSLYHDSGGLLLFSAAHCAIVGPGCLGGRTRQNSSGVTGDCCFAQHAAGRWWQRDEPSCRPLHAIQLSPLPCPLFYTFLYYLLCLPTLPTILFAFHLYWGFVDLVVYIARAGALRPQHSDSSATPAVTP